jgi:hypothetical protein
VQASARQNNEKNSGAAAHKKHRHKMTGDLAAKIRYISHE